MIATKRFSITHPLRVFGLIWFGQLFSLIGSSLTGFALGVWVYQQVGSVTQYTLTWLFATLPAIVMSPLAGTLADRWNRRWVMFLSDSGAALSTFSIMLLLWGGHLQVWHIYLATIVSSAFGAFQWPAYSAATTQLVPKQHFGRASGLVQFGQAAATLVSPALAGVLLGAYGLEGVILIDFVTFLLALTTLLLVRIPNYETTSEGVGAKGSLWCEATFGWRYITARPGLLGLLIFLMVTNFIMGIVRVSITPLVLSFASAATLGLILSIAGCGMVVGTLVMSAWGGPQRRMYGVLGCTLLQGVLVLLGGLRPSISLVASAAFVLLFIFPILSGSSEAIWLSKVALGVQGRVFAMRNMIAWSTLPFAFLVAGPLVDDVFEPLLAASGPLAGSLGQFIGVGPGRGIGLLFVILGIFSILATVGGYLYPRLRLLDDELPDVVD